MSRRPALVTQADLDRAVRVAEVRTPPWGVEILPDGTMRIVPPDRPVEKQQGVDDEEIVDL